MFTVSTRRHSPDQAQSYTYKLCRPSSRSTGDSRHQHLLRLPEYHLRRLEHNQLRFYNPPTSWCLLVKVAFDQDTCDKEPYSSTRPLTPQPPLPVRRVQPTIGIICPEFIPSDSLLIIVALSPQISCFPPPWPSLTPSEFDTS